MKIAVVGATGLVGRVMMKVLEERYSKLGPFTLLPSASPRSCGKQITFRGENHTLLSVEETLELSPDIVLFSAGKDVSLQWAPVFAEKGSFVIDNSSAWRMISEKPLVVPEVNAYVIKRRHRIISNPNCSTIQMVLALAPLHRKYSIKRIVVSTYQSVTGSGARGLQQLMDERSGLESTKFYPHPIDLNLIPHGGYFLNSGYTSEEEKLVHETRVILDAPLIHISATVVRVPVTGGHSESVNVEFENEFDMGDVMEAFRNAPGISVVDDPSMNQYPMPLYAEGRDDVFVGRIRRDYSCRNAINLWIVSDNLRKGAATNAVQIAEYLVHEGFVKPL